MKPLANLINLSFSTGLFPEFLNELKLFQYLKGDQQDCNNYRTISLLSNISKIIEKLVPMQLYGFLEFNNCFYTNQFGFRNLHSTNHSLITITEKLTKAIDTGEITYGVFLDLQKASDTVDHENNDLWFQLIYITCNLYMEFVSKQTQHHYITP